MPILTVRNPKNDPHPSLIPHRSYCRATNRQVGVDHEGVCAAVGPEQYHNANAADGPQHVAIHNIEIFVARNIITVNFS